METPASDVVENDAPPAGAPVEPCTSDVQEREPSIEPAPVMTIAGELELGQLVQEHEGEALPVNAIAPGAPTESQEGATLTEVATLPAAAPVAEAPSSPPPAPAVPAPPPAVKPLPRRPRLRSTFSYNASDELELELTLMDERRNLIHRLTLTPAPGGMLWRIFETLVTIAASAATEAGVFGTKTE